MSTEEKIVLPSAFQVDEEVDLNFHNSKVLKGVFVAGVTFTDYGKVLYDIRIPVGFDTESTRIHDVDSVFVTKEPK